MRLLAKDITFKYKDSDQSIFENFTLSINGPGFISIFGFSGCGKSTLARIISGELSPKKGQVCLESVQKILLSYNTERIPGWYSVETHLRSVIEKEREGELKWLLKEFGLWDVIKKRFSRLSMGQKNRVNLLRYLLQDFDCLILDEVLANVDEPSRNHILSLIKKRYPEKLFIYISHNVEEVCIFSKEIVVFPRGIRLKTLKKMKGLDFNGERFPERELLKKKVMEAIGLASIMPQ